MATVQQIIDWVDRYYPNSVSDANMIIDLDQLHKSIYNKIIRKKNIYKDETSYTVADQLTYTLPTDCKPENIIKISVSDDTVGNIDSDTEWTKYEYATHDREIDDGTYWGIVNENTIILSDDGEAIDTSNYEIKYLYFPSPPTLSAVSDTPDLDSEYHDLLKYGLTQMVASQGQNPDTEVADYYQKKFDERFAEIEKLLAERYTNAPIEEDQLESRW